MEYVGWMKNDPETDVTRTSKRHLTDNGIYTLCGLRIPSFEVDDFGDGSVCKRCDKKRFDYRFV